MGVNTAGMYAPGQRPVTAPGPPGVGGARQKATVAGQRAATLDPASAAMSAEVYQGPARLAEVLVRRQGLGHSVVAHRYEADAVGQPLRPGRVLPFEVRRPVEKSGIDGHNGYQRVRA